MFQRIRKTIRDTLQDSEFESIEYQNKRQKIKLDKKIILIIIVSTVSLVFIEYIGKNPGYTLLVDFFRVLHLPSFSNYLLQTMEKNGNIQLNQLTFWVLIIFIYYLLIPIGVIKFIFREKLSSFGLRIGNIKKDYGIYLIMLIIMLPIIYFMSKTQSFQLRYPFYNLQEGEKLFPSFCIWQTLYFIQLIGVEFFFRGFLLHGTKHRFGFYSIFFMVVPYCMIHFGKPMAETISAIVAGIALGILSLKSKSIVPGILIHYSVAIIMDFLALYHKGYFN